jgi:hypothetical protein
MAKMQRGRIGSRSRMRTRAKKKAAVIYSDELANLAVSHLPHIDKSARKHKTLVPQGKPYA